MSIKEINLADKSEKDFQADLEAVKATNPKDLKEVLLRLADLQEFPSGEIAEKARYFKKHQRDGIFHYYKVVGDGEKKKSGYQIVLNFLNSVPFISVEYNSTDEFGIEGTWNTVNFGEEISEEQFTKKYAEATSNPQTKFLNCTR